ncbi:T6SS phospholipase effector Tle1-like catalytic domain-containing protein [Sporobolomyces koalae]|uniref:T6SS phospholipase effector Tle1-like catalytic domain-containing protein n=1 Tax=Sporobolomyces koalae TaxID=500713 RepID=UPI00317F2986
MKRLVILCDGTLEDADAQLDPDLYTNIGRLSRAILEEDQRPNPNKETEIEQIKMYLGGVGTEDGKVGGLVSGAFGTGIMETVRNIYSFLSLNWESGDEIFLFGFSRGAYTVRLVASLISVIGILHPRKTMHLFPALFEALDQRSGDSPHNDLKSAESIQKLLSQYSKDKNQQDLEYAKKGQFLIKVLGIFDTVSTRGRPSNLRRVQSEAPDAIRFDSFGFDECRLESCIEHAYQALALDEHRIDYLPVLWSSNPLGRPKRQILEQVWFAGAHSDIGGGYKEGDLQYLALWWMCSKVSSLLAIDMQFLRAKLCTKTVASYGTMPAHKSRIGQYLLTKSVDRAVPTALNPWTNERIHFSVKLRPCQHLRKGVSGLLDKADLFTSLSPLEQDLKDQWPAPVSKILPPEDLSLSDTEHEEKPDSKTTKPVQKPDVPPRSSEVDPGSLSDEKTEAGAGEDGELGTLDDDDWLAARWRENQGRIVPNEYPSHRRILLDDVRRVNPFRAISRIKHKWQEHEHKQDLKHQLKRAEENNKKQPAAPTQVPVKATR